MLKKYNKYVHLANEARKIKYKCQKKIFHSKTETQTFVNVNKYFSDFFCQKKSKQI